ncbi:hypothetical protein SCP_0906280 [Sparassis crispa]|uniref:Pierisin-like domain-containing protein n=1 Tax=Sparassis crispa TaxID=139825 RepID=A0A401GX05_9APHY|nr:hypothetical protein SCP_0906280 [Sparassis crispa]GBE86747.1 hypothetical protein SCP_0906280 [Sparassis crispa]
MSDSDPFTAAVFGWFRDDTEALMNRIAEVLARSRLYPDRSVQWRPTWATDFRNLHLPASAERLIRWDIRRPEDVFRNGFAPKVQPSSSAQLQDQQLDIATYVLNNVPSIFVSTTRTLATYTPSMPEPLVWTADNRLNRHVVGGTSFKYEIYAHGGIDVNESLGTHRHQQQNEVAFAGGIRREFVRSAVEYRRIDNPDGTTEDMIVRVYYNPYFDWNASGRGHGSRLPDLPQDEYRSIGVEVVDVTFDDDDGNPSDSHRRELRSPVDEDILMTGEGHTITDFLIGTTTEPRFARAVLPNLARSVHEVYVFAETKYVLMHFDPPGSIINGPKLVVTEWPSLRKAKFAGRVDAILPNPDNDREAYFFSGDSYALVNVQPGSTDDYLVSPVKTIRGNWPSLTKAGFDKGVDAILPNPHNKAHAYFFRDSHYALIDIAPGTTNDRIINGPKSIYQNWPSLRNGFTNGIEACLPNPSNKNQAYFFKHNRYVLIEVKPGTTDDILIEGPADVGGKWPALKTAGLY